MTFGNSLPSFSGMCCSVDRMRKAVLLAGTATAVAGVVFIMGRRSMHRRRQAKACRSGLRGEPSNKEFAHVRNLGSKNGSPVPLAGGGEAGFVDGDGTSARFHGACGITIDGEGNLFIADYFNDSIRKVAPDRKVSTVAGRGKSGFTDGVGAQASFRRPLGVTIDNEGNLFVADEGNNAVRKITPDGFASTWAGSGETGLKDGHGAGASFHAPMDITIDNNGNLFVADRNNNAIRRVAPNGCVSTFAGSGEAGCVDGEGTSARFDEPIGVTIDANGYLFVADCSNHCIREVAPNGMVSTLAGSGEAGFIDGEGELARFHDPTGITIDGDGNLFVADGGNRAIRRVTPNGSVSTFKVLGFEPLGIVIDARGNVVVTDGMSISTVMVGLAAVAPKAQFDLDACKMMDCTDLSDVSFFVGDEREEIKAHRLILMNRSDYFKTMLSSSFREGLPGMTISLPHLRPAVFRAVLTYLYRNTLHVNDDIVIDVAQKAQEYQLVHLQHECARYCQNHITSSNAIAWLVQSEQLRLDVLGSMILAYVCQNMNDIKTKAPDTIKQLGPLCHDVLMKVNIV